MPSRRQADLLGAALVAGVDHGPHAPTIAIARMAMTCGIGINNAMASAANVFGEVHGKKVTIGGVELKSVWTDPEFDPSLDAFYYARVLEIPTPRWTTIQARELGIAPPDNVAATIQERAWSSPIWYTATQDLRTASKGTTVADLKSQGATALDDAALNDLIVGKSTWVRNNVTGEVFSIAWTEAGQRPDRGHATPGRRSEAAAGNRKDGRAGTGPEAPHGRLRAGRRARPAAADEQ